MSGIINNLDELKKHTKIVADSGSFKIINAFAPTDATTNPSLILLAVQQPGYSSLMSKAIKYAKKTSTVKELQLGLALDRISVEFGLEILKIVPGRVSTECDANLSFNTSATVMKAQQIMAMYEKEGIPKERVLVKIAATWEGIKAAEQLKHEGIHCNLTLLFSMAQAVACATANVQLVSPFVGRIMDWHSRNYGLVCPNAASEPGVVLVKQIFEYYKRFNHQTEIMAASFRNIGEIVELAGCDLMTISPKLLSELSQTTTPAIKKNLNMEDAKLLTAEQYELDEEGFRWMMHQDAMATEMLTEGIRRFTEDMIKLKGIILEKL